MNRREFSALMLASAGGAAIGAPAAFAQDAPEIVEMALGAEDAPVTIVEYASFTCPHCANFHTTVFKDLKTNYIDTGKVRFIYRDVYFDRFGLWAAMVARCGGEMRFFGIADMLYSRQKEWIGEGDPATVVDNLKRIGKTAGLTDEALDACLQDGAKAEALVAWYEENAKADDISSTPSFIVNDEKFSNMSYDDFAKAIDERV
ncbi:DsbA family protein [Qingshengfaniella alkalisoli]|uniref:DsbA family protein n=1 Tax=Qingshengfaniella alkalisoli TaxID=2599296 RepID=A0A5B8I756_9RHOB|nr:DsbA family protein [Qingshengfaniella alkalisoli]QDY68376.1 DsbA family protein [Qingshengfaniella alkalisoli]